MNANYLSSSDIQTIYAADLDYSGMADATISGMIGAASRMVDGITNATKGWDFEVITGEVADSDYAAHTDADGNLTIPLIKRPLLNLAAVSSIQITLGTYSTTLNLTSGGLYIFSSPGPSWEIIYPNSYLISIGTLLGQTKLSSLRSYRYFINLSYSGGYMTIPEDIRYATSLLFRDIYAKRFNQTAAFANSQGGMRSMYAARGDKNAYSPFRMEAEAILQRYNRVW